MASRDVPQYRAIADALRQQILLGELRPGDRLPTEPEMIASFGVSRTTVREAVRTLVLDGLVETRQGRNRGSVVRDRTRLTYYAFRVGVDSPTGLDGESDVFFTEVRRVGMTPTQTIVASRMPLPADIAEQLEVKPRTLAVLRHCVRSVNGVLNSYQDSWYRNDLAKVAPELLSNADIVPGTTRLLAARGVVQVAYRDQNSARMPTRDEARLLHLAGGTPVFEHRRTGYTADRPVRVSVNVFAGDRAVIGYTVGDPAALPQDLG